MLSPEEFIKDYVLSHEYDPKKRREYYLRTRKLKGRQGGEEDSSSPGQSIQIVPREKTPGRQSTDTEARVAAMQKRLETLRRVLSELVKQAQARSGIVPGEQSSEPTKDSNNPSKQTEKQKKDAADRSKEYYEENKDEILTDKAERLRSQIQAVVAKIREMREQLESVRSARQRRTGSVGVGLRKQAREGDSQNGS